MFLTHMHRIKKAVEGSVRFFATLRGHQHIKSENYCVLLKFFKFITGSKIRHLLYNKFCVFIHYITLFKNAYSEHTIYFYILISGKGKSFLSPRYESIWGDYGYKSTHY
jgi:hypothetical protein